MTTYVALLADAVGSRDLAPRLRARLQEDLHTALLDLNARVDWRPHIAARFAVTLGDELQVLLTSPQPIWDIVHVIRGRFRQVDWIVACGRGALTTALPPNATAPELDGPCFHEARTALERAKRERRLLAFGGFSDARLDGFAGYYSALYWNWTRRQRLAAHDFRAPEAAGEPRPRLTSAVSHFRRRMAWPLVAQGDKIFRALLEAS